MKLLSLFSGIGAFEKALYRLKVNYELVNYCEIDKYASKAYAILHDCDESLNLGDITKIDTTALPNDIDLITYGFPCQDISLAGKQKGFEADGERTRSGLFFEALRIIEDTKPRIAIAENVKNLTSKKFSKEFDIVLSSLEYAGYNNYWKILNAKDFGIPQNRERVFIVSIRKDLDNGMFKFPDGFELQLRLKDMLEDEVDEKYYLDEFQIKKLEPSSYLQNRRRLQKKDWRDTLCARDWKDPKCVQVGNLYGGKWDKMRESSRRVYSLDGISPTIHTCKGGDTEPKIAVKEGTKRGYAEAMEGDSINLGYANSGTRRGRVGKQVAQTLTTSPNQAVVINQPKVIIGSTQKNAAINHDGICPTLTSAMGGGGGHIPMHNYQLRVRKLTPLECWRLMGFDDEDFYKIKGISNTQLYKMAGNSIVVDVLANLFIELLKINILKGIKL